MKFVDDSEYNNLCVIMHCCLFFVKQKVDSCVHVIFLSIFPFIIIFIILDFPRRVYYKS